MVEEREAEGELRVSLAVASRWLVTVVRQSTTVPKTSVRRALGGLDRDMMGDQLGEAPAGREGLEVEVKKVLT